MRHLPVKEIGNDGWLLMPGGWTFNAVNGQIGVINVPTDFTRFVSAGWRARFTQTTVKQAIIIEVTATTITIDTGAGTALVNAAISAVAVSPMRTPLGWPPSPSTWSTETTSAAGSFQANPVATTWYNPGTLALVVPEGLWILNLGLVFRLATTAAQTSANAFFTMSTSNSSSADTSGNSVNTDMLGDYVLGGPTGQHEVRLPGGRMGKVVSLAATTIFYLICRTTSATGVVASIGYDGGNAPTIMRAVSAYA